MLDDKLRIFTLNLNNQRPDPRGDLLVRDALIDLRPDLISLQEVDWNGEDAHQAVAILEGLDYQAVHQFDLQRPDRPYGTLIASRWSIVRSDLVKLPSTERGKGFPRAIQAAENPEAVGFWQPGIPAKFLAPGCFAAFPLWTDWAKFPKLEFRCWGDTGIPDTPLPSPAVPSNPPCPPPPALTTPNDTEFDPKMTP